MEARESRGSSNVTVLVALHRVRRGVEAVWGAESDARHVTRARHGSAAPDVAQFDVGTRNSLQTTSVPGGVL